MSSAMSRARTAGTLAVMAVLLVVMLVFGWNAVSAPFPQRASSKTTCKTVKVQHRIYRQQITVSVYNGTKRSGLADRTMAELERRSFKPGEVANAPSGINAKRVTVLSTTKDDPQAVLVAQQFKPQADIVLSTDEFGAGIDVVLGPGFKNMRKPAPKFLRLDKPISTCVDAVTPDTGG
jgi:hypothetical protein